jgi:hypothetical protein
MAAAQRGFASVPAQLNALVSALPHLEVAHFPAKGYKWSTSDVKVRVGADNAGVDKAGALIGKKRR